MFPVQKIHIFYLINKQFIVMPGWYRTLTAGYLNQWSKFYYRMLTTNLDFLLRMMPSSYLHPVETNISYSLDQQNCGDFPRPCVFLNHILQFTYESNKNRPVQPLWSHCWKLRRYNGVRWTSITILFGYFINHTTHVIYYVLINCYCWK
jgi:hypothetical protein